MTQKNQIIQKITEILKEEFKPSKLFLFGSQTQGTASIESDYDFVMVLPEFKGDRMKNWERCNELIRQKCGVRADVFTYSEKDFEKRKLEFSSIAETAFNTGREIDPN